MDDAEKELAAFRDLHKAMPEDLKHGNLNLAKTVLAIPLAILEAKFRPWCKSDSKTAIGIVEETRRKRRTN